MGGDGGLFGIGLNFGRFCGFFWFEGRRNICVIWEVFIK